MDGIFTNNCNANTGVKYIRCRRIHCIYGAKILLSGLGNVPGEDGRSVPGLLGDVEARSDADADPTTVDGEDDGRSDPGLLGDVEARRDADADPTTVDGEDDGRSDPGLLGDGEAGSNADADPGLVAIYDTQ